MLPGLAQSIATLTVAFLYYTIDFIFTNYYDKQRRATGSARSWNYTFFCFMMITILVIQPILFPAIGIQIKGTWGLLLEATGILMIFTSLALYTWCRAHLQHFYAERIEVQPEHRIIDSGPYSFMRHPIFTSFFGIATGLFLVNPALTTLILLFYAIWDFTRAAQQEEDLLSKTIPQYAQYANRTPRFLPNIWKR